MQRFPLNMPRSCTRSIAAAFVISAWMTLVVAAQNQLQSSKDRPTTVDAAVHDILSNLSDEEKMQIRITRKDGLMQLHFGLVTGIRNRYGLLKGNDKLLLSACGHPCRPDDASVKIIEALWEALQK